MSTQLNLDLRTETNVWNKNQGVFRYGVLDRQDLIERTNKDFNKYWKHINSIQTYAFTHWDEQMLLLENEFTNSGKIYYGIGSERMDICVEKSSTKNRR